MRVIIHCSASNFGNAIQINDWHKARGFSMIGYHYIILNGKITSKKFNKFFDGAIESGRPIDDDEDFELDEVGAHAFGYNKSVGICLIGNSNDFTYKQMASLEKLIKELRTHFPDGLEIMQHSDVDPRNKPWCAGLDKNYVVDLNFMT